jgi:hypothetical protein
MKKYIDFFRPFITSQDDEDLIYDFDIDEKNGIQSVKSF